MAPPTPDKKEKFPKKIKISQKSVTQPQKTFSPQKNNMYRHPIRTNTIDKSILWRDIVVSINLYPYIFLINWIRVQWYVIFPVR